MSGLKNFLGWLFDVRVSVTITLVVCVGPDSHEDPLPSPSSILHVRALRLLCMCGLVTYAFQGIIGRSVENGKPVMFVST